MWLLKLGSESRKSSLPFFPKTQATQMVETLRQFNTRTAGQRTPLAKLEWNGREFTVRDGKTPISVLPGSERAQAMLVYDALCARLMLARASRDTD